MNKIYEHESRERVKAPSKNTYPKLLNIFVSLLFIVGGFIGFATTTHASDRYWVGNGGNWSDATNHWADTSGGTPNIGNLPTSEDNVFFDANSFTLDGQTVTNDAQTECKDLNLTGVTHSPTFAGGYFLIYGSVNIPAGITITAPFNFSGSGTVTLTSASPLSAVYIGDNIPFSGDLTFIGNIQMGNFFLFGGTTNFGSSVVSMNMLQTNSNGQIVNFNTSTLVIENSATFIGDDKTLNFDDSNITSPYFDFTGDIDFDSATIVADVLEFETNSSIDFNHSTINAPVIYIDITPSTFDFNQAIFNDLEEIYFSNDGTFFMSDFPITGDENQRIIVGSINAGPGSSVPFTISIPSGIISSDYLDIYNSEVTGGATWYAGATSTDHGNNSGWIFSAAPTYTIGGTISGLTGTVVLQNNGGDNYSTSTNGSFVFTTALNNSASYAVTVSTQPTGQSCTVTNGSGTVSSANITNVSVSCLNTTKSITASAGSNGSISPSGSVSVNNGADQAFTITPNSGYHIDTVTVDSSLVSATSPYTFTNVTADHTISATFVADSVVSHGGGGGFSPPYPTAPAGGFTAIRDITNSQNKTILHFGFGNDITNIAISDNINFAPATYINATSSVEWTATTTKIIYVKYCNRYGRCSNPISLQINAYVPIVSNSYKFYRNLAYRMTGTDVLELQKYLNTHGFVLAQSGAGSLGKETNYFGLLTYKALVKFQKSIGWSGTGFFGPMTRGFINK